MKKQIWMLLLLLLLLCSCTVADSSTNKEEGDLLMLTIPSIQLEQSKKMEPFAYNLQEAKKKQLVQSTIYEEKYLRLQAAYLTILNYILVQDTPLDSYQTCMDEDVINFPINENSLYREQGSFGRSNISLRNLVFIERLTSEELALLNNAILGSQVAVSEELLSMVRDTWKELITVRFDDKEREPYQIVYERFATNRMEAMNDALTFEISFATEYDEQGNIPDDEYELRKYEFALELAKTMEKELADALDCHVAVFIKN